VTIVWDEPKRIANISKHGLDFARLPVSFFETALFRRVRGGRWRALGRFEDRPITVIFAPLGSEAISVISMRPASREERSIL
jgi:uncharacterized protein